MKKCPPLNYNVAKMVKNILYTYLIIILLSVFLSIVTNLYLICLIPIVLWLIGQSILNFRVPYFLLIACIPLSMEYHFSPSLSIDLPTEPMMIGLSIVYVLYLFLFPKTSQIPKMIQNPLMYLLILAWIWSLISTIFSSVGFISVKWLLAKTWYLATCVGIAVEVFRSPKDIKYLYFCLMPPLFFTLIWALWGQYQDHFSFSLVNNALLPFYRNHVNYSSLLVLSFPWALYGKKYLQKQYGGNLIWILSLILLLIAIYFSYARIAYFSLIVAAITYIIVRFKAMKITLLSLSIISISAVFYLKYENQFIQFAPKYEKTVSPKDFNKLLDATYKGQDVSSMERVNRWVAGSRMVTQHLWTGFGPNSFYPTYQKYMLADFRTYVSENKEGSTVHCYYFLLLLEQGLPAFCLFMMLVYIFLIKGEKIYHQIQNKEKKSLIMTVLLSQVIIFTILLFNDMIETDKVGILFYTNIAILLNYDIENQKK